jgi:hypothetical protein
MQTQMPTTSATSLVALFLVLAFANSGSILPSPPPLSLFLCVRRKKNMMRRYDKVRPKLLTTNGDTLIDGG